MATAVLARAVAFDVPEINCFIRRGSVVGRERIDVMLPVAIRGGKGVSAILVKDAHARTVTSIAEDIRMRAGENRTGTESKTAQNKYLLNRIPWPLRRPVFRFLKWITVDMGIKIESLDLSADSFGSFVVSDIGSFGLNTGMTSLMSAAKVPAVISLGQNRRLGRCQKRRSGHSHDAPADRHVRSPHRRRTTNRQAGSRNQTQFQKAGVAG